MTWGEFKKIVDSQVDDDTPIWYIDISYPTNEVIVKINNGEVTIS